MLSSSFLYQLQFRQVVLLLCLGCCREHFVSLGLFSILGGMCQAFLQFQTPDPPAVQLGEHDRWVLLSWTLSRDLVYFEISAQERL